jgi:hypothetical protein
MAEEERNTADHVLSRLDGKQEIPTSVIELIEQRRNEAIEHLGDALTSATVSISAGGFALAETLQNGSPRGGEIFLGAVSILSAAIAGVSVASAFQGERAANELEQIAVQAKLGQ